MKRIHQCRVTKWRTTGGVSPLKVAMPPDGGSALGHVMRPDSHPLSTVKLSITVPCRGVLVKPHWIEPSRLRIPASSAFGKKRAPLPGHRYSPVTIPPPTAAASRHCYRRSASANARTCASPPCSPGRAEAPCSASGEGERAAAIAGSTARPCASDRSQMQIARIDP